jgi:hypothetical protein
VRNAAKHSALAPNLPGAAAAPYGIEMLGIRGAARHDADDETPGGRVVTLHRACPRLRAIARDRSNKRLRHALIAPLPARGLS